MAHQTIVQAPPKNLANWRLLVATTSAGFGGILFGYDNAFLGGTLALPSFQDQFGLSNRPQSEVDTLSSNIIITFQAGCFLGCFIALPSAETLGRKLSLVLASIVFTVGAAIQLIGALEALYTGRFLTGLGVGPLTCLAPLYISEIAPPRFRGRCVGFFEICFQFGALLGFWINYGSSINISDSRALQWHIPVAIQLPLIGVFLLGAIFLPETPRFLMKKEKYEAALTVLARLRHLPKDSDYVQSELADIRDEVNIETAIAGITKDDSAFQVARKLAHQCFQPGMMYRISVGVITQFFAQLSGTNGISYYAPRIFTSLGVQGTSTGLFAIGIYGVVKSTTAVVALVFLIDHLGRKTLLLAGCTIMIISLFFIGSYLKLAAPMASDASISSGGIAACAFIYIFSIGYTASFAGVPWILSSEAVPVNVRAISATLGAATQWIMNLAIVKATPYLISSIGYGTFYLFGSCIVMAAIYVWFFVPETKGVPLEHMAAVFGQKDTVAEQRQIRGKMDLDLNEQATVSSP